MSNYVIRINDECCVCFDEIEHSEIECNHPVHKSCIIKWGKPYCPICKNSAIYDEMIRMVIDDINDTNDVLYRERVKEKCQNCSVITFSIISFLFIPIILVTSVIV